MQVNIWDKPKKSPKPQPQTPNPKPQPPTPTQNPKPKHQPQTQKITRQNPLVFFGLLAPVPGMKKFSLFCQFSES